MPQLSSLDPDYKAYLLKKNGLDPDKFDLQDDGTPVPKAPITPQPTLDDTGIVSTNKGPETTLTQAVTHGALNAALPTAAGLGGAGLASLAFAPETGGLSLLGLLGIAGAGAATGAGASAIQNQFTTPEWKQQLQKEQEEHPVGSFLGENIPQALAFNPLTGAKNLAQAISTGGKSVGPTFARDIAANMGISGGIDTAQQLSSGQPFDPVRLGESLGTAALFNSPTRIGKALMFHGSGEEGQPKTEQAIPDTGIQQTDVPLINPSAPSETGLVQDIPFTRKPLEPTTYLLPESRLESQGDIMKAFEGTGLDEHPASEPIDRELEFRLAKVEKEKQDAEDLAPAKNEVKRQTNAELQTANSFDAAELGRTLAENQIKKSQGTGLPIEKVPPAFEEAKPGYEPEPDYTGNVEQANIQNKEQSDLEERQQEVKLAGNKSSSVKYQDEQAPITPEQKQKNRNLFTNATPEYRREVARIAAKRGVTIEEAVGLTNPATGKEVLGQQNTETRTTTLNPNKAEVDTPLHEIKHQFLEDLRTSKDPYDQHLVKEVEAGFALHAKGANEGAAIDGGLRGANRLATNLEGTPIERARAWGKDFVSRWKFNLGVASPEDAANYASQRLVTDAPSFGFEGKGVPINNGNEGDKQKYDEAVGRLKEEKDFNKKGEIQKEIEEIKNRNGGMPPKEKFQDESALKYQETSALDHSSMKGFRSALDDILLKDGEEAKPIVKGVAGYLKERPEIEAKYRVPVEKAAKGIPEDRQDYIESLLHNERETGKSNIDQLDDPKEKNLYNTVHEVLKQIPADRNAKKMPVTAYRTNGTSYQRLAKSDPHFFPQQLSPHVIEALQENRNSDESKGYKKAFIDHHLAYGDSQEQAEGMWKDLTNSFDSKIGSKEHFRGLDVEQGAGLPEELRRPGLMRNLNRYFSRVAQARAFHDNIESKPDIASKIGYKTDPWGKALPESDFHSPRVNAVMDHIRGEAYDKEEGKIKAANRVATAGMLGPLTNIHIVASNLAGSLSQFMPHEVIPALKAMVTNFHNALGHAVENGSVRQNRKLFSDLLNAHSTTLEKINSLGEGIGRLNGRGVTDYVAKGILQSAGEHLVRIRLPMAEAGDKNAIRFMKQVDPYYEKGKTYSEDALNKLATNFGSLMHGAHDARTMPSWMLHDTALQPFFSLASWSIGQTNNFMKNAITPGMKEGNWKPLLMTTLGAGLGGYVIKQAREAIANKKSPIPGFEELANSPRGVSGNLPLVGYNLAAMASFAGYAGILSTGVKTIFDAKFKNAPQGATFPLDEIGSNIIKTSAEAASALFQANNMKEYTTIATKAIGDILKENIQGARIITSWGDEAGVFGKDRQYKKNLNTEENDLRRYKMASGLPYNDQSTGGGDNPYYEENRKSFKHELDLGEAAKEVPDLVHEALEKSTVDGRLNVETFRDKLKALKGSSYPSMPDPERTPQLFYNYLHYLQQTQGSEAASKRMVDYLKNNEIGKVRSSMIPSI